MYKHIVHKNWETLSHSFNHGAYTSISGWHVRYSLPLGQQGIKDHFCFISQESVVHLLPFGSRLLGSKTHRHCLIKWCFQIYSGYMSNDIQGQDPTTMHRAKNAIVHKVHPLQLTEQHSGPPTTKKKNLHVWNLCTCIELLTTRNGTRGIYSCENGFSPKKYLWRIIEVSNKFQMQA